MATETSEDIGHRVTCPECRENETERVDLSEPSRTVNSGTRLVETRSCNNCYAGYTLTYVAESVTVTHEPEVEV